MSAPRQMTANTLNALKGWPQMAAVDFHSELATTILTAVLPGSVVHLNSAGKYELGVGNDSVMPMFTFQHSLDPDVINEADDAATVKGAYVPVNPTGQLMALPAVGAYELVSTTYDDTQDYPPNTPLTAATGTSQDIANALLAGVLTPGTLYTNMIVGLVSRGVVDNGYGAAAVAFWPFPVFPTP